MPASASESDPAPPPGRAWRLFAIPAALALVGYVAIYAIDAHLRVRRGPWEVTFRQEPDGTPGLRIDQPGLGISNVTVRFEGERADPSNTNALPATRRFDEPLRAVPFGKTAFDDLMYLPGTVVLHCFGHEVQMLPRALYLDRRAVGWTNGSSHRLEPSTRPAQLTPPPARRSRLGR